MSSIPTIAEGSWKLASVSVIWSAWDKDGNAVQIPGDTADRSMSLNVDSESHALKITFKGTPSTYLKVATDVPVIAVVEYRSAAVWSADGQEHPHKYIGLGLALSGKVDSGTLASYPSTSVATVGPDDPLYIPLDWGAPEIGSVIVITPVFTVESLDSCISQIP